MPQLYAKAASMLGVFAKTEEGCAEIHFRDSNNQAHVIDVPETILGGLVAALMAIASQLKPSGFGQMLNLTGGRLFHIPDGRSGLELTLNGTLRLPLIFQKEGIAALRNALDELKALPNKRPDDKKTSH